MNEIKVIDAADQQFSAVLSGRRVTMRLRYNVTTGRWSFDLSIDENPVLMGRRVVTGVNLLAPFNFGMGGLFAVDPSGQGREPGRYELPRGLVKLIHATDEEVAAARAAQ